MTKLNELSNEELNELSTEELNSVTGGDINPFYMALMAHGVGQGAVAGAVGNVGIGALMGWALSTVK